MERGFDDLPAVDARQPQVGDDNVERELAQKFERALAGIGLDHIEALLAKPLGDNVPQRGLVVHEEQMYLGVSHLGGCQNIDAQQCGGQAQTALTSLATGRFRRRPKFVRLHRLA